MVRTHPRQKTRVSGATIAYVRSSEVSSGETGGQHGHAANSRGRALRLKRYRLPVWHSHIHGSEFAWAVAFIIPYVGVLLAFAVFPIAYGFWMASDPALYVTLFSSDEYVDALISTALYVGIGANASVFLALLLSGFFMRRGWWVKALLVLSMLPWALPAQTAFISFHWMMIYWGFLNSLLEKVFGIAGPDWLSHYWLALGANIVAYTWKTHAVLDPDLPRRAHGDPPGPLRCRRGRRRHWAAPLRPRRGPAAGEPLFRRTLLATIWMLGDYNTPDMVSGGAPLGSTDVLATLGVEFLLDNGAPTSASPR